MSDQQQRNHAAEVWKGIGLTLLLHLLLFIYPGAFLLVGIVQLIYVIPAIIIARKRTGVVQGIAIAAAATFLLNAACYGYVLVMFF